MQPFLKWNYTRDYVDKEQDVPRELGKSFPEQTASIYVEPVCMREHSGSLQAKILSGARDLPHKRKRPQDLTWWPLFMSATTYSPTHFRVQYNRPCGA